MEHNQPASDRVLLRQANGGKGRSFGELFDRHRDRVFRHAFSVLSDATAAEDVTAMVFYEAWRKRSSIRLVGESAIAWLLVTANYTIRNYQRQQRRYRDFLTRLPQPDGIEDIAQQVVDQHYEARQAELIRMAFAKLNRQARDVLTLCIIEQLSMSQAAEVLGVPEGTVKSRLSRAKNKLGTLYSSTAAQSDSPSIPSFSER